MPRMGGHGHSCLVYHVLSRLGAKEPFVGNRRIDKHWLQSGLVVWRKEHNGCYRHTETSLKDFPYVRSGVARRAASLVKLNRVQSKARQECKHRLLGMDVSAVDNEYVGAISFRLFRR